MFDKLRNAFSNVAKTLSEKELKEKDIDDVLSQLEIALLESDVATEVIDSIKSDLKKKLVGSSVDKKEIEEFVKDNLIQIISQLFESAGTFDIMEKINSKKASGQPCVILFVGINGTGKTTTLAKIAHLIKQNKFSVVIAAADTFRAGAIEQLSEHANKLNVKMVAQNYGADPAAVARDAVLYAKSHKIDCVLIDTAGRMQTSKNLMDQIQKITKVVNPDLKIFVGDSLAGNDTVNQAKEFFQYTKFDGAILTKIDADARGGAALSIVKVTSRPVLYVGVGQQYGDLEKFDKNMFIETVFGKVAKPQIQKESQPELRSKPEPQKSQMKEPRLEEPQNEELQIKLEPQKPQIKEPQPQPANLKELKIQQTINPTEEKTSESQTKSDPFEGIEDKDISTFADLYDVPPPENDPEASALAKKIREWIKNGRPKPGQKNQQDDVTEEQIKQSKKEKHKKGLFGWLKK